MAKLKLAEELFVIPDDGNFILFAPLNGGVMKVNAAVLPLLRQIEAGREVPESGPVVPELIKYGIVCEGACEQPFPVPEVSAEFCPTSVTLFPTSDCNLRCVYCYANAGETRRVMRARYARAALDVIVGNAERLGEERVELSFHGGGEPIYGAGWVVMREAIGYAKSILPRGKILHISTVTNGVLSSEKLDWLAENVAHVSVSIDGPPNIQNAQRPMRNGHPTALAVERTVRFLETHGIDYGLRATITRRSCSQMVAILTYFWQLSSQTPIHLEPLFVCGRCRTSGVQAPRPTVFVRDFLKAREYALAKGKDISYSGMRFGAVSSTFCGAAGSNFAVTPNGDITSCYEVSLPHDPRASIFFYGGYSESTGKFEILDDRLRHLRSREINNLPGCRDCFLKYDCCGDCLAKVHSEKGDMFRTGGSSRCVMNQRLSLSEMNRALREREENHA